ncbi:MAG: BamA/TamA family outer membrane protein [Bacteroidales bacterium]|nr:BamA/TamA family outer membrane protein [Bacteroidales bacterium]
MKKISAILVFCTISLMAYAGDEVAKTGLNFGPLPAIGYSSDLGWHYGALSDIYWYGDGSTYPDYRWKANVEVSKYSKGNTVLHSFFDSKYIIPGMRVSAAVSWFGNKTTDFYGFNGASSVYVPELSGIQDGTGFYLMRRDIFRIQACLQGYIGGNWGWAGGITYWNIKTGHAENKSLGKPWSEGGEDLSLYDLYVKDGVIPDAEKNGGQHLELKAGVVYDTRDHENNPTRGTNLEVYMFGSPDIISKHDNSYLKLAVHFKQFFPVIQDKLTFGAHLAYQGLIAGNAPYYMLQTIQSINMKQINTEGLGSTCTLRGTINNRLQGNGYAWMNTELRWSFAKFRWINQNWTLATNPFFDMGMIVQPYRAEEMKALAADLTAVGATRTAKDFYKDVDQTLHCSAGIGLHVIMNQNFNINFEFGKCFDPNDGTGLGINIGLNYIF